jgi:hypothetical protein
MDVLSGDTLSHDALSEVVNVTLFEMVLETVTVWFGGLVAPCTA